MMVGNMFLEQLIAQSNTISVKTRTFTKLHATVQPTPSVRKYLSSKWIKRDVPRTKIHLDTPPFIHFDDNYFRTEGDMVR